MMSPESIVDDYIKHIIERTKADQEIVKEIRSSLGFLVERIIEEVKKATIIATDGEGQTVIFQSIE